jgi:hypothetical protein
MKIMKNKKAWIRIVEAFLAIMLVLIVILTLHTRNTRGPDYSEEIYELQNTILKHIANDFELRRAVLMGAEDDKKLLMDEIENKIPAGFDYEIKICELGEICNPSEYDPKSDLYSSERMISSTLDKYDPKIVKIFMWRKER